MEYWNYQIFCNDTALDVLSELEESEDIKDTLNCYLNDILSLEDDYIEEDTCQNGLVAIAIIDSKLNGINHSLLFDEEWDDEEYVSLLESINKEDVINLKKSAIKVMERILQDDSELKELWEENEDLYEKWENNLLAIKNRILEDNNS